MPKRKATAWPPSILSDPDVLSLDDEGRFVLCKTCHVHYAMHGGKKPKPIVMNSNFRTRAWDVHKERTTAHRMQREHEAARRQQAQQARLQRQREQERRERERMEQEHQEQERREQERRGQEGHEQERQQQENQEQERREMETQEQERQQLERQEMARQEQERRAQSRWEEERARVERQQQQEQEQQQQQQQQQQQRAKGADGFPFESPDEPSAASPNESTEASPDESPAASPLDGASQVPTTTASSHSGGDSRVSGEADRASAKQSLAGDDDAMAPAWSHDDLQDRGEDERKQEDDVVVRTQQSRDFQPVRSSMEGMARWRAMHDDVSRALRTDPSKRRRASARDADSGGDDSGDSSEQSGDSASGSSSSENATSGSGSGGGGGSGSGSSCSDPQTPQGHSRRQQRVANALAGTEEIGYDNREMVARKLKSLNEQYNARNLRPEDMAAFLDPSSAAYKAFWGNSRDVFTSQKGHSVTTGNASTRSMHHHYHHHHYYSGSRSGEQHERGLRQDGSTLSIGRTSHAGAATTIAGDRLPSSSERALMRQRQESRTQQEEEEDSSPSPPQQANEVEEHAWELEHGKSLASAIDRLTSTVSAQLSELLAHKADTRRSALVDLNSVVAGLREQQEVATDRLLSLQQRQLDIMEAILKHKLWRERMQQVDGVDAQRESKQEDDGR